MDGNPVQPPTRDEAPIRVSVAEEAHPLPNTAESQINQPRAGAEIEFDPFTVRAESEPSKSIDEKSNQDIQDVLDYRNTTESADSENTTGSQEKEVAVGDPGTGIVIKDQAANEEASQSVDPGKVPRKGNGLVGVVNEEIANTIAYTPTKAQIAPSELTAKEKTRKRRAERKAAKARRKALGVV